MEEDDGLLELSTTSSCYLQTCRLIAKQISRLHISLMYRHYLIVPLLYIQCHLFPLTICKFSTYVFAIVVYSGIKMKDCNRKYLMLKSRIIF